MGLYKHLTKLYRVRSDEFVRLQRQKLIVWRKEPAIKLLENPTNLARARSLGYKAKQGVIIVRIRIGRGGKVRPQIRKGRRSKHKRQRLVLKRSYQWMAEERVAGQFTNMEVLNSYNIAKDGIYSWYEVILIDPNHPNVAKDKHLGWISSGKHKGRVYRGLTSAAKKSRGLLHKGEGTEKIRPSLKSHDRRGK